MNAVLNTQLHNGYFFKINNGNTRATCGISSDLIIKTPEQPHCCHSDYFTVKFERYFTPFCGVSILGFEQVDDYWTFGSW